MLAKPCRRLPLPRSLRWQFTLALLAPALLIVAGGLAAVYGWRISSHTARQLAEQRLARLQHAQDLVRHALLIERKSNRMLTAHSLAPMQTSYLEILEQLDLQDALVLRLGQASNDLAVLALNQANQLFRNTVHIVAQLRRNLLADKFAPPESTRQQEILLHFHGEMQRQVALLVDSTHDLSARFTSDYQKTMRQLTTAAAHDQVRALALLAGSVLLAWLVSRYFLGRRVVGRLQQVSNCLRLEETHTGCPQVPVQGDDEIGNMARAVEQFLEDRRLLVQTQRDLRQNMDALRKSETRLQDINEDLERSNAELEQFAYVASHDLQEPLRKVGSYMELLAERYREQLDRDAREFIDYAVDGARRMKIMIDDLLMYSRVGTGGQTFVHIDMMNVMHHVLGDLELAIRENHAVVSYDALPVVTADNSQLQQLLRNLIGNALKYRGADPPKIHVSAQRQMQTWRFSVKDNGIGIEPRFFERIFQIFQRLHPRDRFSGTGIGLAVCKKIVERHGGTIWVESTPGQGSTFSFTIADQKEDI